MPKRSVPWARFLCLKHANLSAPPHHHRPSDHPTPLQLAVWPSSVFIADFLCVCVHVSVCVYVCVYVRVSVYLWHSALPLDHGAHLWWVECKVHFTGRHCLLWPLSEPGRAPRWTPDSGNRYFIMITPVAVMELADANRADAINSWSEGRWHVIKDPDWLFQVLFRRKHLACLVSLLICLAFLTVLRHNCLNSNLNTHWKSPTMCKHMTTYVFVSWKSLRESY